MKPRSEQPKLLLESQHNEHLLVSRPGWSLWALSHLPRSILGVAGSWALCWQSLTLGGSVHRAGAWPFSAASRLAWCCMEARQRHKVPLATSNSTGAPCKAMWPRRCRALLASPPVAAIFPLLLPGCPATASALGSARSRGEPARGWGLCTPGRARPYGPYTQPRRAQSSPLSLWVLVTGTKVS